MFDSVLVANRGEIAVRVIRTARRMGIRTTAVYSDADAGALHVEAADQALRIGPGPGAQSYLNQAALLSAIAESGTEAVHPGYGFLSENPDFATAVGEAGMTFVGPSPQAIRAMGSKIEAKRLVASAGAPVVPGYEGADQSARGLAEHAARLGYPLLIKASMGGGGRGMRIVSEHEAFDQALAAAKREAAASFGDDTVLLERYLTAPKHIEIQILADNSGRTLSLNERDCSVQRRHQKVIEEAPAPGMDTATRRAMGQAAVRAARAVGYVGAGTVEFVTEAGKFYFLEMNTRLQVEHPVTEAVTGLDLVEWQLRIAAGELLPFDQDETSLDGHAVEARIYAENPRRNFLPSTGSLHWVRFPGTVRVDTGVRTGSEVSAHYDPMMAKVVAHGADRQQAVARLRAALRAVEIAGVEHNVAWLANVLGHPAFVAGTYTTRTVEAAADVLVPKPDPRALAIAAVASLLERRHQDPWSLGDAFEVNLPHEQALRVRRGRDHFEVRVTSGDGHFRVAGPDGVIRLETPTLAADGRFRAAVDDEVLSARAVVADGDVFVMRDGSVERITFVAPDAGAFAEVVEAGGRVLAPMPGQVVSVAVSKGDRVRPGDVLVVVEAMKMEHEVRASGPGTVAAVRCAPGERVEEGVELVSVDGPTMGASQRTTP
ncbi:MAG: ATP-grasp domain-containing protein [Gammaproteobacteria bacterium]|nr:ATP-grasp domain-containing protein [Gammaproteobacteria bacterium]MYK45091.1 ATP-grasp domain-containing protein [Gammaproteobacteria bacterium]